MASSHQCPLPATATGSVTMVVVPNQTPTVAIAVGPDDTLCQYSTAVFTVTSATFTGASPVYTWYKNGVSTGVTGSVYSYVPVNANAITVKLNSSYRCPTVNDVSSNSITMHVDSTYVPIVSIATDPGLEIAPAEHVTFTASVTRGGPTPTYQWLKNGLALAGETGSEYHTTSLNNNDSVSCVVWGTGDCSFYTFNSVKIKVTTGFVRTTSRELNVVLVPNPNNGEFVVKGTLGNTGNEEVSLEVTNMLGQVVYSSAVVAQGGNLEAHVRTGNALASGMYILNVRSGTENKVFRFIVKQ